ncbi:MAG: TonB-dependent receptor plug domain-containing protein [Opitutae bacterium]|nr:TonB-dependent receptor plug domain-containing protein [Opitutae bacterium]
MNLSLPLIRRALAIVALGCVFAVSLVAAEAARTFSIPAGDAAQSLKQFAQQAGREIVFAPATVNGVKTPDVQGELTAAQALDLLLAGTGLVATTDAKTGAIAVRREPTVEAKKVSSRPADAAAAGGGAGNSSATVKDGTVQLDAFKVTGSRIRTLVGEQTMQPVFTLDRRAIQRTGAANLGDVFRVIPQISSASNGMGNNAGSPSPLAGDYAVSANLRGFQGASTLILVDGRRVTKGSQVTINDRYDIGGIPLSAVDRIEVMLDGASAIYGADAVAGVINIITRKDYNGTEVQINYDNTFRKDASIQSYSLTHSVSRANWNARVTLSHERSTPLAARDTATIFTNDRRAFGGVDNRSDSIRVVPGWIETESGLNLPGLATPMVPIPANSSGTGLTATDYANAYAAAGGASWDPFSTDDATAWGERFDAASIYASPRFEQNSVLFGGEYTFNKVFSVYAQGRYVESENVGYGDPYNTEGLYFNDTGPTGFNVGFAFGLTLPANYPGNPFGVPIILHKTFFDNLSDFKVTRKAFSGTIGFRGELANEWRYDVSATLDKSQSVPDNGTGVLEQARVQPLLNAGTPPTLLYDSTRRAIALQDVFRAVAGPQAVTQERPKVLLFSASADGKVWKLPAGDVRMALTAESTHDELESTSALVPSASRRSYGFAAEVRAPVISPLQKIPLLYRLDASVAARHDRYSDFPSTTNPTFSVLAQPISWLSLRVTRSEGYRVPPLFSERRVASRSNLTRIPPTFTDPLRNNEPITLPFTSTISGNPNIDPEVFKSNTFSLTLDVPGVPGLSVQGTRWETDYSSRIVQMNSIFSFTEIATLYPEFMIRAPSSGTTPGRIVEWVQSWMNVSASKHAGWDAGLRYNLPTAKGRLDARVDVARTDKNEMRVRGPNGPITPSQTGTSNLPWQLSGSLFWSTGAMEIGTLATYNSSFNESLASTTVIGSSIRWDLQFGYDFGRSKAIQQRWARVLLKDTRVRFTVFNVFDQDPPLADGTFRFGTIEQRQQHYAINITRQF